VKWTSSSETSDLTAMARLTILACLAASVAVGLAREEQCSGLSCAATPSRSLLQAQVARKIDAQQERGTEDCDSKRTNLKRARCECRKKRRPIVKACRAEKRECRKNPPAGTSKCPKRNCGQEAGPRCSSIKAATQPTTTEAPESVYGSP
jgi:hypothetical protein